MMSTANSGIYQLENLPFSSKQFHDRFSRLAGPLSLYDAEDNPEVGNENPDVERPLTPVEEAIKGPPTTFSAFAKLIRPRLTPKDVIPGLTVNDQQELIGVIMNEINNIWGDMKRMPPDPFLTTHQNMELQRRLAIEIVTLAQGLFVKFLDKAQRLNSRGVFSGIANMSRLKTQLALEANKSFNVLSIRRNLAMDMKAPSDGSTISSIKLSQFKFTGGVGPVPKTYKPLVVRQEEERAKLRLSKEEALQRKMENELNDLQKQMPIVDAENYYRMIPYEAVAKRKPPSVAGTMQSGIEKDLEVSKNTEDYFFLEKKCPSAPYLPVGESLLDELGILREDIIAENGFVRSNSVDKLQEARPYEDQVESEDATTKEPIKGSSQYAAYDLNRLLTSRAGPPLFEDCNDEKENGNLPPLLQALAYHSSKKAKKIEDHSLKDNKEDDMSSETGSVIGSSKASSVAMDPNVIDDSITEFTGEEHPQPAVVSLRLPDKSVVRTSDVRVSNRVNKSSVALTRYPTVYNDLTSEIDAVTVKWLDRNLFIGEEIKEVYQEVIRTMNTDHLLFDKDSYVQNAATNIDMSCCTSSSTLLKPRSERIINENLRGNNKPPWGNDGADNWRNSPKFGGLGREDILQAKIGNREETGSKSYNSWLAWWRSTITYDDYLKYISTQENDFLSVIFHLYDADRDFDEELLEENRPDTVQMLLNREREKKVTELKHQKTEFTSGVWNVNAVLLGGLGQDPEVEDEELLSSLENIVVDQSSSSERRGSTPVSQVSSVSADKRSFKSSKGDPSSRASRVLDRRSVATTVQTRSEMSKEQVVDLQDRLERLWTLLCMPDVQRLDMAIKYSSEPYKNNLLNALSAWEVATEAVLQRESLLTKLEDFERKASDPNRFFERGAGRTSLSRIREAKIRDAFNKKLVDLDREMKRTVTLVKKQFKDDVTFQGRSCLEKLRYDRTEMLYWLQQERRQEAINKELVRGKEIPFNSLSLPPLSTNSLL
ncbi:coiled-coil domain-containing protein 87-like [Actinia tenebrosa]|uniref:Coiled-coil domain-containing protein 87-like n=1 Tax=Actinia tenebrosa TaxID=6105 RepID=A0A6P8I968_ACTTE|nr:coiled-coil domain-containing protein 87-like [Actinia tenebrosa]